MPSGLDDEMEFCDGGTLQSVLYDDFVGNNFLPDNDELQATMGQLLNATAYMHARNVIHRDIKPANVMLSRSRSLTDGVLKAFWLKAFWLKG